MESLLHLNERETPMGNGNKKMRRRSRMKVLKILQSFSQGTFIAFVLSLLYCGRSLAEPGYLDFDNLPETNFTCAGKVIGGYYADLEASCQMFHVCTIGQGDEPMDIKFLCLNGTVFDQETRVCERVDEVDCTKSERFYYLNLELYGNTIIPAPEESSSEEISSSDSSPISTSTSTTTTTTSTTTTTTKKPTTTTPSRRFIFNNSKGSSIVSSTTLATPTHSYSTTTSKTPEEEEEYEYDDEEYEDSAKDDSGQNRPVLPTLEDDGSFSPQQFTLQQQTQNSQPKPEDPTKTGSKPAVSFQQQHFQNGGTLAVTNSHVTVTTHTTTGSSSNDSPSTQKKNAQQYLTQKQKHAFEHQQLQQQQALLQQQMLAKQHQELQKKQQEAAVQQQQKAIQQQQKQVQQHESEIKNHQAQLLLHTQKINRQQQKPAPNKSTYNPYDTINPQQEQQQSQKSHHQQQQQQQQQQQSQAPKRIPLLAAVNPLGPPQQSQVASQPPSASQLAPFRLKAQGFKLPSQQQQQEERFEGYRRQPPPQVGANIQVSLHLPFEQLRHQKDISLQFDPEEEDLTQIPDRKELKRSDPPFHSSIHGNNTPPPATLKTFVFATKPSSTAQPTVGSEPKQLEPDSASYPDDPVEYYDEDYSAEPSNSNHRLDSVKSNSNSGSVVAHKRSGEDQLGDPSRVHNGNLPATQASRTSSSSSSSSSRSSSGSNSSKSKNTSRFIINNEHHKSPTNPYNSNRSRTGRVYDGRSSAPPKARASYQAQPKVIVTTSTSIRDNSGRTINYSISSNSSPSTTAASHVASNAKYSESLTRGYDEYKEDDVLTDPFFLDVPKVGGGSGRRKRDASSLRKRRKRFLYIVPRFM